MEKTNKVMRIVLSIVTFVAIGLFVIALFALPLQSGVQGSTTVNSDIYDFIKSFISAIKQATEGGSGSISALIGAIFSLLITIVLTLVFGIIALVKGIILLVKTIKGMSGSGEFESLLGSLVGFGSIILVYIALLLGNISASQPGVRTGLGSGSEMMLSVGLVALVVAGVYRIAVKDDRKLVNKILGFGTSMLVIIGLLLAFSQTLSGENGEVTFGLFWPITGFIQIMSSSSDPDSSVILAYTFALIGVIAVIVSLGMAKSVIANGFTVDEKDKKPDFEKSSIIKCAVWLGLMVIGFILIAVGLNKGGLSLGAGAIVGMVMAALALGCAIVNKVLAVKFAEPKEEAPKAE